MPKLGAQVYDLQDFLNFNSTYPIPADGQLIGAGIDKTIIELTAISKTVFPRLVNPQTSAFDVSRVQPVRGPLLKSPIISNLTLRVKPGLAAPNMCFNGLRVAHADGALIEDVLVEGVPGYANIPPGETFGLSLTRCTNSTLRRVVVDGQYVGGAGFGFNSSQGILVEACQSYHQGHSHGFTAWQCAGVAYHGSSAYGNGSGTGGSAGVGFNHEDTDGITHVGSASYGNSLASHRYYAAGASRHATLIGVYNDGPILVEKNQQQTDIDTSVGNILTGGFIRR